jgi:hypothetical protein
MRNIAPFSEGSSSPSKTVDSERVRRWKSRIPGRFAFRRSSGSSDIAGQDIRAHAGKVGLVIEIVRNWLSTTNPAQGTIIPSGSVIAARYRRFRGDLPHACARKQLNPQRLTFGDFVALVVGWIEKERWEPG